MQFYMKKLMIILSLIPFLMSTNYLIASQNITVNITNQSGDGVDGINPTNSASYNSGLSIRCGAPGTGTEYYVGKTARGSGKYSNLSWYLAPAAQYGVAGASMSTRSITIPVTCLNNAPVTLHVEGSTDFQYGSGQPGIADFPLGTYLSGNAGNAVMVNLYTKQITWNKSVPNAPNGVIQGGAQSTVTTNQPIPCPAGQYVPSGATACQSCLKGSSCGGEVSPNPVGCAVGTFTANASGTYTLTGATQCATCQAGWGCNGGSAAPVQCGQNTFPSSSTTFSLSSATSSASTYVSGTGAAQCAPCPTGYTCAGSTAPAVAVASSGPTAAQCATFTNCLKNKQNYCLNTSNVGYNPSSAVQSCITNWALPTTVSITACSVTCP